MSLEAIYLRSERIHFFPILREEFVQKHIDDPAYPEVLHGRCLTYPKLNKKTKRTQRMPVRGPSPLSTRLRSRQFQSIIAKAQDFNDLNYDIYICPNPLLFSKRYQMTVPFIRFLVLESDETPKEEQYAFLHKYRKFVRLAVDSGRRSIQMLLPIPTIVNPDCIKTRDDFIEFLQSDDDSSVYLQDFEEKVDRIEELAKRDGLMPDSGVLRNFAGLMRCPGFRHPLSGKVAKLVYLHEATRTTVPVIDLIPSNVVEAENIAKTKTADTTSINLTQKKAENMEEEPPERPAVNTMLSSEVEFLGTAVNTMLSSEVVAEAAATSFLDALETYENLCGAGVPARHQRIKLHRALFTAAHLWGWGNDEERLRQEWHRIVSIQPTHIGCDVDDAVEDMLRHRAKAGSFQCHLPNTAVLPTLEKHEIEAACQKLEAKGCPDPVSAARIVAKVLYPKVRECPKACMRGTVAVQSRDLQRVSVWGHYKPALVWLEQNNIIVTANRKYTPGKRSRCYWINAPLILWLLGFRTPDLVWKWASADSVVGTGWRVIAG